MACGADPLWTEVAMTSAPKVASRTAFSNRVVHHDQGAELAWRATTLGNWIARPSQSRGTSGRVAVTIAISIHVAIAIPIDVCVTVAITIDGTFTA